MAVAEGQAEKEGVTVGEVEPLLEREGDPLALPERDGDGEPLSVGESEGEIEGV